MSHGERTRAESVGWVYMYSASETCVCVNQVDGEFDRGAKELRDDIVVRERVTGKEPRNLCAYDECTQDI